MANFIKSVGYALSGLQNCFKTEAHFKVHAFFSIVILIASFLLRIAATEWLIVLACIGSVLAAELFNTAIEQLCNVVKPEKHPAIKLVKDLSAGAVLVMVLAAISCGLVIFLPKLFNL